MVGAKTAPSEALLRGLTREEAGKFLRELKGLGYSFEGNVSLKESSAFYGRKVDDWREL